MKKLLISIRPQWVAKIVSGEKTLEIRKTAPKDLPCEVYIYCTKDKSGMNNGNTIGRVYPMETALKTIRGRGKIVASFTLKNTMEFRPFFHWCIEEKSCVSREKALDYLDNKDKSASNPKRQGKLFAWAIDDLKIFDEPKELYEFKCSKPLKYSNGKKGKILFPITKAPQSWCYVEVDE